MSERAHLEARWLDLTRRVLPGLARARGWPIHADHCFQRVLLDAVFGDVWYAYVPGRPAYRAIDRNMLAHAVELAEAVEAGCADLALLNLRSLDYRGK